MNNTDFKYPNKVLFITEEMNRSVWEPELEEVRTEWQAEGPGWELFAVSPEKAENPGGIDLPELSSDILVLADSKRLYMAAREKGFYTVGYVHAGNAGEQFPGADYLVAEPQYIDRDSWQKIYERAAGLPWTILETKRCIVRELVLSDLDALYNIYDDQQAKRFLTPLSKDKNKEKELLSAYISKIYRLYGYGYWAIISKENNEVIGRVGFSPYAQKDEDASFGYVIRADQRHKGIASEVCSAVISFAHDMLGFETIGADTHSDNNASRTLLHRLGFSEIREEDGKVFYQKRL